jgi:hypothetical protein
MAALLVLAALLLPALAWAKAKAESIQCLNNLKQLSIACQMYQNDNNGNLVKNLSTILDLFSKRESVV